ncbi:MAG: hypothetical protein ACXVRI_01695 [Gaiellaceae bacterium]
MDVNAHQGRKLPRRRWPVNEDAREFASVPVVLGMVGILGLMALAAAIGLWLVFAIDAVTVVLLVGVAVAVVARPSYPSPRTAPTNALHLVPDPA